MHFPNRVITTILIAGLFATGASKNLAQVHADGSDPSRWLSSSVVNGSNQSPASSLRPVTGVGRTASGWVAAEIDVSSSPSRDIQSPRNSAYRVAAASAEGSDPSVAKASPESVSVLEGGANPSPSVALTAPTNTPSVTTGGAASVGVAGGSASLPTSPADVSALNPLSNLTPNSEIGVNAPQAGTGWRPFWVRDTSRSNSNRFVEWFRQFPPLNLNRSTSVSETAPVVWQNQVQSFFQNPNQQAINQQASQLQALSEAGNQAGTSGRRGLFSSLNFPSFSSPNGFLQAGQSSGQLSPANTAPVDANSLPNNETTATQDASSTGSVGSQPRTSLLSQFRGNLFPSEPYQAFRNPQQSTAGSGSAPEQAGSDSGVSSATQGGNPAQGYSAFQPPKQSCWNDFWGRWFGRGYRTSSYRVPVTYYRPVLTTDPTTGQQVVVQQPCTSFITQQQRTPVRLFRSARPDTNQPALMDPNACPPGYSYVAAMPGVIYPGLGYAVTANSTPGVIANSGYVMATGALQPISYPGVAVWNGAVIPTSAVLVAPPAAAASSTRPLTTDDLNRPRDVETPSDDLSPMPAPRLESYQYSPSATSEGDAGIGVERSSQRLFSAPSSIANDAARFGSSANRGTNYQWRMQNAADSTAMLRKAPPSDAATGEQGALRGDVDARSIDGSGSPSQSNGPSLEELLRSENFVGAEPIAAPRNFQPRYRRSGNAQFQSLNHPDSNVVNQVFPAKVATESAAQEVHRTSELTPISFTQPVREIQTRSISDSSRFIKQPANAR